MSPTAAGGPTLTWLYVPGDRPDRFRKALDSDADEVILDLEDAVAQAAKSDARAAVRAFLSEPREKPVQVRINGVGDPMFAADLEAIVGLPGLSGIRLPKVEDAAEVRAVGGELPADGSVLIHPLVESARGLEAAADIAAAHPLVGSIGLGEADLRSDLGLSDDRGLLWSRGRIVVAARAAGLPPPAMSAFADLADEAGLARSCREGRSLGFLGRTAIHPRQLAIIVEAFLPDDAEVDEATELLAALATAADADRATAVLSSGRFVDRAMVQRARQVVELARRRQNDAPNQ